MFVASYHNTMRKFAQPTTKINIDSEGKRRRLAAERERFEQMERIRLAQEQLDLARARFERDRAEATDLIAAAAARTKTRSYRSIEKTACRVFNMNKVELHSNRRVRHVVMARQFVMYWASRLTKHSLPEIGRMMGGRDHTTVLHGKRIYPDKRAAMGRTLRSLDRRQSGDTRE